MRKDIYTPRSAVAKIESGGWEYPSTSTKIEIGDFQISISMAGTNFYSNLSKVDIAVYDLTDVSESPEGKDVTQVFAKAMGCLNEYKTYHTFDDSDDLFDLMVHARKLMAQKKDKVVAHG